jgi:hypothetical protein
LTIISSPVLSSRATEIFANHVETDSDLATAARSLKDGLELALKFTAQYGDPKATSGGSVEGLELDQLTLSAQEMQAYSGMQAAGQLSLQPYGRFWVGLDGYPRSSMQKSKRSECRLPGGKIYTEAKVIEILGEDYATGLVIDKKCCG